MKNVYLLYEGDTWLSSNSLVLMGIFDNIDDLSNAAKELIEQRAGEHMLYAIGNYTMDDDYTKEDVVNDLYEELLDNDQTSKGDTRYMIDEVELNVLGEILL